MTYNVPRLNTFPSKISIISTSVTSVYSTWGYSVSKWSLNIFAQFWHMYGFSLVWRLCMWRLPKQKSADFFTFNISNYCEIALKHTKCHKNLRPFKCQTCEKPFKMSLKWTRPTGALRKLLFWSAWIRNRAVKLIEKIDLNMKKHKKVHSSSRLYNKCQTCRKLFRCWPYTRRLTPSSSQSSVWAKTSRNWVVRGVGEYCPNSQIWRL